MAEPDRPDRPARPRRPRSSAVRLLSWGLGGLVMGVAVAFLVLNLVARTNRGHEFVLGLTLDALGKSVNGTLAVERIAGDLFEGAKLYDVRLVDRERRPFVLADSAFLEYDVRTLLTPRIVINRLTLYNPRIWVFQMPGDSLWNYQALFAAQGPRDTTQPRVERVTILDSIRVVNGTAVVELPFRPDTTLSPRARLRELRVLLADTAPVMVRAAPKPDTGYVRTVHMTALNGRLHDVRFAPGSERGSRFPIDSLSGNVFWFRQPARLDQVQGTLALFNDHVEFDVPVLRMPGSRLATSGVICTKAGTPLCDRDVPGGVVPYYDIAFRGDTVAFRDLQWLYRRFPGDARGSLSLLIETRPEGTLMLARDADLRAPGTRMTGSFGMIFGGDTLRFVDVDLQAQPVRVSLIERMLPEGLPVRGLVLGGAEIRGNNAEAAARRRRAEAEPDAESE
ncbi:MAG TPA: hypothetical protein VHG91_09200 [Longimicrobium sp.]|nr:hypothetical protein [Longimicrobium sp.]